LAAGQAFDNLLAAITGCQAEGMTSGRTPSQIAIDGELHNVGIDQDPEDMVANALSDWIQLR
jgi:hypothetical protein